MGRVTSSQLREDVRFSTGIPYFKYDPGKKYKVLFPSLPGEKDIFAYMESTHDVKIGGFKTIRCVNADYQVSADSKSAVVKVAEDGTLALDAATGKALNDGSCPLCELHYLYNRWVYADMNKWKEENPGADDAEYKKRFKDLINRNPVTPSMEKNRQTKEKKIHVSRVVLGVVFELKQDGTYVLDSEGAPVYNIVTFNFSDSRYRLLHAAAANNKEFMSDVVKNITCNDGVAWQEFIWNFPAMERKEDSGKGLTINAIPGGRSAVELYNGLKEKIEKDLTSTNFDDIFLQMPSLRVRSIQEIEKELQGKLQQYRANLSEDEKSDLDERLSEDEKYISSEDAEKLLDEAVSGDRKSVV